MHIVIDGYNFIFRVYDFKQTELQEMRERFLLRLQNYVEKKQVRIEVVFDSQENDFPSSFSSRKGLKIVFCQDADDYIREVVRNSEKKASILVVSEDGEILRDVRRCGVKVKSPSEFDTILSKGVRKRKLDSEDSQKPSPESISEGDVTAWLKEYSQRHHQKRED